VYLIYRPDGQEEQRWEYNHNKIRTQEMEAVERRTGWDYGTEFLQKLQMGNSTARRALLWMYLRRQHHTLRYEDVDFAHDEVVLEYTREELQIQRDALERMPMEDEQGRQAALHMLDEQIAAAPDPAQDPAAAGAEGKALLPASVPGTGSP
jgi:hypothetical protein